MLARRSRWLLIALLGISALSPPRARADVNASVSAEQLAEQHLSAELGASIRGEASRAFSWRLTWTAINVAVAGASIGGVFVLPRSQEPSLIIGAISSGISAAFTCSCRSRSKPAGSVALARAHLAHRAGSRRDHLDRLRPARRRDHLLLDRPRARRARSAHATHAIERQPRTRKRHAPRGLHRSRRHVLVRHRVVSATGSAGRLEPIRARGPRG